MAATPEKKVKNAVEKLLNKYGAYYFFAFMGGYGRAGIPDIICCVDGRFIAVECKAGKNKTTEIQDRNLIAIKKNGGIAVVVNENNLDELKEMLHGMV